jgi:hypothetical protein
MHAGRTASGMTSRRSCSRDWGCRIRTQMLKHPPKEREPLALLGRQQARRQAAWTVLPVMTVPPPLALQHQGQCPQAAVQHADASGVA